MKLLYHLYLKQKMFGINDDVHGTYSTETQSKFKTTMLRSVLCDYSDAYILVKGTITVTNIAVADADRIIQIKK